MIVFFLRRRVMKTPKIFVFVVILFVFSALPAHGGITDGLVSYWTFDETSGSIAHDTVGTNNGNLSGDATWTTGVLNGGLQFSGNGWVNVPDSPSLNITGNEITISAWYRPSTNDIETNSNSQIVSKWLGSNSAYTLGYDVESNYIWFVINADNNVRAYSAVPVDNINEWYHLVGVYNGSEQIVYINAVPGSSFANTGNIHVSSRSLRISGYPDDFSPLHGIVDDIRIYNRALSYEEVVQLYSIPEPATILLIGAGCLFLNRKRIN